jgi:hypothetical protein
MSSVIENIMAYCVDEDGYGRMFDFKSDGIDTEVENYERFRTWNIMCLGEMSDEDQMWVWGLCKRIGSSAIGMMDMEDCGIWKADQFFFDTKKKLCIVHPR